MSGETPDKQQRMVLLLDKCIGDLPGCSQRLRYSDLTDAENTHWHTASLMPMPRFPSGATSC